MFTQKISWSRTAWWPLVVLLLVVIALVLAPAFLTTERGLRNQLVAITGVIIVVSLLVVGLFSTLRISIDEHTLTVGFGPIRERIPLERVAACGTATYRWIEWGGFGIRLRPRGKLYNVPGDGGVAVQVNLHNGRRILFSSPDPTAVCRALRERNSDIVEL
jgi:hypothetical protein